MKRWSFWRRVWLRRALEQEMHDELEFHKLARADDLVRQGHTPAEANRIARIELGMVEMHKDQVRQAYGLALLDRVMMDCRTSWKSLRRHRYLAVGAVLILSFTVAVNVALYAMFDNYQSAAPSWIRESELMELSMRQVDGRRAPPLRDSEFDALQATLSQASKYVVRSKPIRMQPNTRHDGRYSTAYGVAANAAYFAELAPAQFGRVLAPFDDLPGAVPVVVLSHEGWQQLMGGRADVVGQSLGFGATRFTVVGVMPQGFIDLQPFPSHFWVSNAGYALWRQTYRGTDFTLSNDVGLVGVIDLIKTRTQLLSQVNQLPDRRGDAAVASLELVPRTSLFSNEDQQDVQIAMWPVFALVVMVLIVACANLGNLMLAKALGEQQELALRASVGASRTRLIVQLCLDSFFIALAAAPLGLLLARALVNPLHAYVLSILAETGLRPFAVHLTLQSAGFAFLLCWLAALVFGLLPALSATSRHLHQQSKRDGAAFGTQIPPSKLRRALVILQVAASFLLLVSAASIGMLAANQQNVDLGFKTDDVIDLRHPEPSPNLRQQIEALPGVLGTTATQRTPLYGWPTRIDAIVDQQSLVLGYNGIDQRYIDLLGIRVLQGRNLTRSEAESASPVALVSLATAAKLWPGQNAVGRTIEVVADNEERQRLSVIGVLSDVTSGLIFSGVDSTLIYLPSALATITANNRDTVPHELLVAVQPGRQGALLQQIRALCLAASELQPCDPWPLQRVIERQQLMFVIARNASWVLAVCALMITLIGLFGVVRFGVANRKQEMGVRMAIGANYANLVSLLLGDLWRQLLRGILLALPLSLVASYGLHSVFRLPLLGLFSSYGLAALILIGAAVWVAWWPARAVRQMTPRIALG